MKTAISPVLPYLLSSLTILISCQNTLPSWVTLGEAPARVAILRPDDVIKKMKIRKGEIIADIGAGSGLFSRPLALATGATGKVYAYDINKDLVDFMNRDAAARKIDNMVAVSIDATNPNFQGNRFDTVFLADTYHHIDNRSDYFQKLRAHITPQGRVVILDFHKQQAPFGPPLSHKLEKKVVIEEMKKAGYQLALSDDFIQYHYYLEFRLK